MQLRRHSQRPDAEFGERHLLPHLPFHRRSPRAPISPLIDTPTPIEPGGLSLEWTTSWGGKLTEAATEGLGQLDYESIPDLIAKSKKPGSQ